MTVPCGKCFECRQAKKQEWCFRLDQELRLSQVSFFVTLTYDDDHLPWADEQPCLCKSDLQKHFKRLRKKIEKRSLKYFAVGEYGDHGARPHYHYLLFYSGQKDRFEIMRLIKDDWTFGFSKVLPVKGAQGYVTKYVLKFEDREFYVPPFSMISQGLGIGYLSDSMKVFHQKNLQSFAIKPGGFKITLPRYYKDKIFTIDEKIRLKKRADLFRHELELKRLDRFDFQIDLGINPFQKIISIYQHRLYQSLKLYKEKKKL